MLVAVIVGALSGESIGFALGRFFGPKIRDSRLGRRIGITNWHRAEYYVDRRGGIAVFVSRFLPVLHSLVPVTVGMSTMSYRRFIAWTAPACVLWALAYVTVGSVVAGGYRELQEQLHFAGIPVRRRRSSSSSIGVARRQEAHRARRVPALGSPRRRRREHHARTELPKAEAAEGPDAGSDPPRRPIGPDRHSARGSRCPAATRWRCRRTTSAGRRSRRSSRRDPRGSARR